MLSGCIYKKHFVCPYERNCYAILQYIKFSETWYHFKVENWYIHIQTVQLASACHSYNSFDLPIIKISIDQELARTNYGVHTFNSVSPQKWQSIIDSEIKLATSVTSFQKIFFLLFFTRLNTSSSISFLVTNLLAVVNSKA
jgi:hypothetical protein